MDTSEQNQSNLRARLKEMLLGCWVYGTIDQEIWWEYEDQAKFGHSDGKRRNIDQIVFDGIALLLNTDMFKHAAEYCGERFPFERLIVNTPLYKKWLPEVKQALMALIQHLTCHIQPDQRPHPQHQLLLRLLEQLLDHFYLQKCEEAVETMFAYLITVFQHGHWEIVKRAIVLCIKLYTNMDDVLTDDQKQQLKAHFNKLITREFETEERHNTNQSQKNVFHVDVISWLINNVLDDHIPQEELYDIYHIDIPPVMLGPDGASALNLFVNDFVPVRSAGVTMAPDFWPILSYSIYYEAHAFSHASGEIRFGWRTRKRGQIHILSKHRHRTLLHLTPITNSKGDTYWNITITIDTGGSRGRLENRPINNAPSIPINEPIVIGCLLDVDDEQFKFYINGHPLAFDAEELSVDSYFSEPYYATAELGQYQQCWLNFGQSSFKFPPSEVSFVSLHDACHGELDRYRLIQTLGHDLSYWFAQPVISGQILPLFCSKYQEGCDQTVAEFGDDLLNPQKEIYLEIHGIKMNPLLDYEPLRIVQSMIDVLGPRDELKHKMDIIAYGIGDVFPDRLRMELFDLLYPYLKISISLPQDLGRHRVVCATIIATYKLIEMCDIFTAHIKEYFFRLISLEFLDEWICLCILKSFKEFELYLLINDDSELTLVKRIVSKFTSNSEQPWNGAVNPFRHQLKLLCESFQEEKWFSEQKSSPILELSSTHSATLSPIDITSDALKLSSNGLSARSEAITSWQSVRSACCAASRIYYYEVILLTGGPMRIGWATKRTELNRIHAIGDDFFSASIDGFSRALYHDDGPKYFNDKHKLRWMESDVIGCLIDVEQRCFRFLFDNQTFELSMADGSVNFSKLPYYAAISLKYSQQVLLNFGQYHFKYAPQLERVDYWSFWAYLEEYAQVKYINLRNLTMKNVILQIDSTLKCPANETKRKRIYYQTNGSQLKSKRKTITKSCKMCTNSTSQTVQLRFECCDLLKFCSNCVTAFKTCSRHEQTDTIFLCELCKEPCEKSLRLQYICCGLYKFCASCAKIVTICPVHNNQ